MSAVVKIVDRLPHPRQTRPGHWKAGCPVCQSTRGTPISVRETDDGRVLLYPFCGCSTEAVLSAVGLKLADLFDVPIGQHVAPSGSRIPARDLLALIDEEVIIASIVAADLLAKRKLNESDWQRLAQAARRIGAARDHARHG